MASLKTMIAALLAGSLAATAGGVAYAKADGKAFDPARYQEHLTKRIDKALSGTDATAEQKKKVSEIVAQAFKDVRAGNVLTVQQRQAFFKNWSEREHGHHGKRG